MFSVYFMVVCIVFFKFFFISFLLKIFLGEFIVFMYIFVSGVCGEFGKEIEFYMCIYIEYNRRCFRGGKC